jgi:putative endonuclease
MDYEEYSIYVMWSEKLQKRYVGSAKDPLIRLQQHNAGASKFTRGGRPWILIHKEILTTKTSALQRERYLKSGVGRKWLDEMFSLNRRKKRNV